MNPEMKENHTQSEGLLTTNQLIYTIGHSNLYDHQFIKLLQDFGITMLADVRSSPYSQYCPQFNRESIEFSLLSAGIDYLFLGDQLGGRPNDPFCYKDQVLPEGKADYLHIVDYPEVMKKRFFKVGIERLKEIAVDNKIAIMCSEEDPNNCHRHHLIGKFLLEQGFTVLHIRKDSSIINGKHLKSLPKEPNSKQLDLFE